MLDTLIEAIGRHEENLPDKSAVCFRNEIITYKKLNQMAKRGAEYLASIGITEGDCILISAVSKPEYIIAMLSIQYLHAITVPVDKAGTLQSIEAIYIETDAKLFLANSVKDPSHMVTILLKDFYECAQNGFEGTLNYHVPKDEKQICEILFTTGTTGTPKGAMLSYKSIYANILNTWNGNRMLQTDVILIPLPLNHSFGMRVLRTALYIGATVVLQNGFTFVKEIEINFDKFQCNGFVCVPASMEQIMRQMGNRFTEVFSGLRYIEVSAGSLSLGTKIKLKQMLPNVEIHNTWGSTETGGALFLNISKEQSKLKSIGKALDNIEVCIIAEDGSIVTGNGADNCGRMSLKGDMIMSGYWKRPELTAETIQNGWLFTNDIVYKDEDGYLYMLGRADDIINVGGEKVSPVEVENIASQYDGIKECACIGVEDPDGIMGQIPILYVVTQEDRYSEEELKKFLATELERYKIPKKYIPIKELPRNQMQKIQRGELYDLWNEMGDKSLINPVMQAILDRRSIRKFTDKEIPEAILDMILLAGTYAPTGHNMQTWRFTVLQDQKDIQDLKNLIAKVAKEKKVYFYGFDNPKVIVLISNDRRNPYGIQDSSCAAENMFLAAQSYGIGSVWLNPLMTLCDEEEIRSKLDAFKIPGNHIVWSMAAFGYPAESGKLLARKKDVIVKL